jgi:hypothetical protein
MKTNKNKGNENIYRKMLIPGNYLEIPWYVINTRWEQVYFWKS